MTQIERLLARIKQLCKENPASLLEIRIITDANGEPCMWFPGTAQRVEGDDQTLIASRIKPGERKVV